MLDDLRPAVALDKLAQLVELREGLEYVASYFTTMCTAALRWVGVRGSCIAAGVVAWPGSHGHGSSTVPAAPMCGATVHGAVMDRRFACVSSVSTDLMTEAQEAVQCLVQCSACFV